MVETVHIVRPNHLNAAGRLFGGVLMQWIDEVAGLVGKRHTHKNVITASVDDLRFLKGAYLKDVIVIIGKITMWVIRRWKSKLIRMLNPSMECGHRSIVHFLQWLLWMRMISRHMFRDWN